MERVKEEKCHLFHRTDNTVKKEVIGHGTDNTVKKEVIGHITSDCFEQSFKKNYVSYAQTKGTL